MPRPRLRRRICFNPKATYFKPAGKPLRLLKEVIINRDELEALRLQNLEELEQKKAAEKMQISQPTFHRILLTARRKITEALIEGKAIKIEKKENKKDL